MWYFSDNNVIANNSVNFNYDGGMYLITSSNNSIENNNFSHTQLWNGIAVWYNSRNNTINNNVVNANGALGIGLFGSSSYNNITNNTVCFSKRYYGIQLTDSTSYNIITNNNASFNRFFGIALYRSSNNNTIYNNDLVSNICGLRLDGSKGILSDNQIMENEIFLSKSYGMYLENLRYFNNISNNNLSNNNLFGILAVNSTNITISSNALDSNERGVGLDQSSEIQVIYNDANTNEISGISLLNSTHNTLKGNTARFNTYEGIYLSNSSNNTMSNNDISGSPDLRSYFGITLYSSNDNTITDNHAGSNYYFGVFNYSSLNTIDNSGTVYNQTDIIQGVRVYVHEALTPALQSVDPAINATYYIVVENLGNVPDTFDLVNSSTDEPDVQNLDRDTIMLHAGENSGRVIEDEFKTVQLNVTDSTPGIYRVKVEAIADSPAWGRDETVKDIIETWTIVQGNVSSDNSSDSPVIDSALIGSHITAGSTIDTSAIINSNISGSTITDSIIKNSSVMDTPLNGIILENAVVNARIILRGNITVNGITYIVDDPTPIDLVTAFDSRDSDLVGIQYNKTLDLYAADKSVSFNISAKDDYFAGSMSVQKSLIPPNGIPEFGNNLSGYVYVNVSDNLVNNTGWLMIKVFYKETELGGLDENSLTLRYYNVSALNESGLPEPGWENVSIGGRNLDENYVWGNISHYSVFSISGTVTPKGVPPKPGLSGGGGAPSDNDNDGLSNIQEIIIGTDPDNPDTDGDGVKDGEDPFPLNPNLPVRLTPTPSPGLTAGVTAIPTDPTGLVTSSVTVNSADGKASVTIPAGTIAKDIGGDPLTEVTVSLLSALPAGVPLGVEYVGYAIQVGPEGARFSQPVQISITFDPVQFEGKKPVLYVYEAGAWKPLETTVVDCGALPHDPASPVRACKATANIDHFSIFVLFAEQVAPTSTPMPSPTPPPLAFPGALPFPVVPMVVVIALVVLVIIGAVVYLVRRR